VGLIRNFYQLRKEENCDFLFRAYENPEFWYNIKNNFNELFMKLIQLL